MTNGATINNLAVCGVILKYYGEYKQKRWEGFQDVPLENLHNYTRQPQNWIKQSDAKHYTFAELRCFFTQRVRLYTQIHPYAQGISCIDAPGFGVSMLHDNICHKELLSADVVLLIMGKGATISSMASLL